MSKIFETPDGSQIQVRSNNAWRWRPDSCQCDLVFETNTLELDFAIHVCELHKGIPIATLFATVLKHENDLNAAIPNPITERQENTLSASRRTENLRIAATGAGEVRADAARKAAIETDLRNKGR